MRIGLRKFIHEGERYPRGYGHAWVDYDFNVAVCYPIPLNIILSCARNLYFKLLRSRANDMFGKAYAAGVRSGTLGNEPAYQRGYKDGEDAYRERILKGFNDNLNKIKE